MEDLKAAGLEDAAMDEWGYVFAFAFFIVMMFVRPEGLMARRS